MRRAGKQTSAAVLQRVDALQECHKKLHEGYHCRPTSPKGSTSRRYLMQAERRAQLGDSDGGYRSGRHKTGASAGKRVLPCTKRRSALAFSRLLVVLSK